MSQHGCPERLSNRSKSFQEDSGTSTMEVFVETLTGTAFEMTVSPSDTIFAIKSKICRVEGIPVAQQHLVYNLREVEDSMSLGALGIGAGARLRLVLALRGGPVCTRRLPPPPARLAHSNNREEEWGGAGARGGCKVTVLVFRDGERVNMVRVRENSDGTYTPLERTKSFLPTDSSPPSSSSSSSSPKSRQSCYEVTALHSPEAQTNAVTLGKMVELRARMRSLSLRRGTVHRQETEDIDEKPQEIQKTRSEETLSYPRLFDECAAGCACACDALCDCPAHAYTLLPPIGTRTDSELSVQEAAESDCLNLSEARCHRELDERILEEVADLPRDSSHLADELAAIPAADYGPLLGGGGVAWRRGFGSQSQLRAPPAPPPPPALAARLLSASTSALERLPRNRLLPALSRHRNREHLHLSDEGLDSPPPAPPRRRRVRAQLGDDEVETPPEPPPRPPEAPAPAQGAEAPSQGKKARARCGWCRKRLSIATQHTCRCGANFCAPHRYAEVHGCLYDYKALPRDPPPAAAPKLPPI